MLSIGIWVPPSRCRLKKVNTMVTDSGFVKCNLRVCRVHDTICTDFMSGSRGHDKRELRKTTIEEVTFEAVKLFTANVLAFDFIVEIKEGFDNKDLSLA